MHEVKNNSSQIEYRFGHFRINPSQQVLIKNEQKIVIGTKPYYLLMVFLKNHGKILKKDEIIEAVWPGQIVTDAALTKQIVRLRKLIEDTDSSSPMIETHRGVGYRFAGNVELYEMQGAHDDGIKNPQRSVPWIPVLLSLLFLVGLHWILTDKQQTHLEPENKSISINLALIPADDSQKWFNSSGLDYLSGLLQKNPGINSINPRPQWYKNQQSEKLAIELTSNKNINYAAIIGIILLDNQFIATVKLRNHENVLASEKISSNSISELLVKINNWFTTVLSAHEKISIVNTNELLTDDNYALESYLQGLFQQANDGNQQKASDYFQSAVNKDEEFLDAWIKLLETHVHLAHFEQAISIAENILLKFKPRLLDSHYITIHYLIAFSQFRLRDEEKAQASLQKSINHIDQTSNPYLKLAGLKSLYLLSYLQRDWKKAETFALQRISLAKEYYPFEDYLAGVYLSLSEVVSYQLRFEESKSHLYQAMSYYEISNDSNGMITALAGLNQLNISLNDIDEGVLLTEKASAYLNTATNPDKVLYFLMNSSMILNLRGLFDRADEYIKRIQNIASELNSPLYQVIGDLMKLHQYYVQNRFTQSKNYVQSMLATFENNPEMKADLSQVYLFDMLISSRVDEGEVALEKYNKYIQKFPHLQQQFANELKRALGHIYTNTGKLQEGIRLLEEAETAYRNSFQLHVANYVGYEILEIMLDHPEIDHLKALERLEANSEYDYLFTKLKAGFLAREGKHFEAAVHMSENKQKANQLWSEADQLLLEDYQRLSK
jgi:DNA-binding winged helix-turn-helix (wHTH) protein/tetratricopeptide (TPR) repeat protein